MGRITDSGSDAKGGHRRSTTIKKQVTPSSWGERFKALNTVPPLLKMVYKSHRGFMVGTLALRLLSAVAPVAMLWIGKLIIEAVELYYRGGQPVDWSYLWTLVVIELVIATGAEIISRASNLMEGLLGEHFRNEVSVRLMVHSATLDVAQFEDADIYDQLERARQQTHKGIGFLRQLLGLVQSIITVLLLVAGFALFVPWLIVLLAASVVPAFFGETHFAALGYALQHRWTESRRLLSYLLYLAANDTAAKEVRLFGLSPYLVGRYREHADGFLLEGQSLAIKRNAVAALLTIIGSTALYGGYGVIIYYTIVGRVSPSGGLFTIGTLTFLMGSLRQSRGLLQGILLSLAGIYEQSLYIRDLFRFLDIEPQVRSKPDALPVPKPISAGFVLEGVSYKYPGSDTYALRDLEFALRPGESVALVGENGAGKTTLVKLLGRLYDPDEGRILLDGVDLRDYDLDDLHRNIGVIFQDFIRYSFLFKENIGAGLIERMDDDDRIRAAAINSLADEVAVDLPGGFDQQLGRRFDGGVDLSGGEWQKLALGRAYMRDAQVLILDEPTAALDARAEYDVFRRFTDLRRGRMAVLISHRFSTVRMADRILVLEAGEVVESGTHDALLAQPGVYAELFNLQAEGYR
ncbi:MAG: ABC transporter ATP-binding protein [Gemmatimonadota bacterium]|nr:ABC transporter ATP-binding protein [Gemmatimonadota bacterium]